MKKHSKIIALLVILALAVSLIVVSVYAEAGNTEERRTTNLVPNGAGITSGSYDGSDPIWHSAASSTNMDNLEGQKSADIICSRTVTGPHQVAVHLLLWARRLTPQATHTHRCAVQVPTTYGIRQ